MIPESEGSNKRWLQRPKLGPVELIPVNVEGRDVIRLTDGGKVLPGMLFLSQAAVPVLQLLDGRNDLRDIQADLLRAYGQLVPMDHIKNLVDTLDENGFIEGDTHDRLVEHEWQAFANLDRRPAFMAGRAYPDDPDDLSALLDGYFAPPAGPGLALGDTSSRIRPRGLVAPHIDFQRGGYVYAWSYHHVDPNDPPDTVVILGVAHAPTIGFFTLCEKDFETPFGVAQCRREMIEGLRQRPGWSRSLDEITHKTEHSIEFQMIWLLHHYRQPKRMRFLPILCGAFHELMIEGVTPEENPKYEESLASLKAVIDEETAQGRSVMIAASVDLSHVGPQFGDDCPVTDEILLEVEDSDRSVLESAARGDHRAFYKMVADCSDRTNICGFPAIYTLLRLLDGQGEGQVVAYDQWWDEMEGQAMVSFAGMIF